MDQNIFAGFAEVDNIKDNRYYSEELICIPSGKIDTETYTLKVAKSTAERIKQFLKGYDNSEKEKIISIILERGLADLPERKAEGERIFQYSAC